MSIKTILTFGHVPKYAGGKQSSGLANVIWQLAKNMNDVGKPCYKVVLAATDIHQEKAIIEGTEVLGWNSALLFAIMLNYPHFVFYYLFKAIKLAFKYKFNFNNIYIKLLFYHYALDKVKPDIVHLHGCTSVTFFEIYNFRKYKIIATIHGISGQDPNIPNYISYKKMERNMNQLYFQFVAFITNDLIRQWEQLYDKPIWPMTLILNAFDQSIFYFENIYQNPAHDNRELITLATIASIGELKGQIRVIQALGLIKNSKFHYQCIGNGSPDQVKKLKSAAAAAQIKFEYLGYQDPNQIRETLKNVDYMILPSSSEGFGLVYLESIACGVPVILPKHLPIALEPNLLSNENAIFLEDESPESIAMVLFELDQYKFNREITANTVLKYSWKNIAREYLDNLKTIL